MEAKAAAVAAAAAASAVAAAVGSGAVAAAEAVTVDDEDQCYLPSVLTIVSLFQGLTQARGNCNFATALLHTAERARAPR